MDDLPSDPGEAPEDRARSGHGLHMELGNNLPDLCRALESVEEFLEGQGIDQEACFTSRFALEEIVTNVIKYAYGDRGEHEILLDVFLDGRCVVLRVTDDGREFNPLETPPPDLEQPIEERPVGGLGIHLLRAMAERMEYARIGGRNVITAFVPRSP